MKYFLKLIVFLIVVAGYSCKDDEPVKQFDSNQLLNKWWTTSKYCKVEYDFQTRSLFFINDSLGKRVTPYEITINNASYDTIDVAWRADEVNGTLTIESTANRRFVMSYNLNKLTSDSLTITLDIVGGQNNLDSCIFIDQELILIAK